MTTRQEPALEPDPVQGPLLRDAFRARAVSAAVKSESARLQPNGIEGGFRGVQVLLASRIVRQQAATDRAAPSDTQGHPSVEANIQQTERTLKAAPRIQPIAPLTQPTSNERLPSDSRPDGSSISNISSLNGNDANAAKLA